MHLCDEVSSKLQIFVAEALGTLIAVAFALIGAEVANNLNLNSPMLPAIASGGGVFVGIMLVGRYSGAHMNPVVTLVFLTRKELSINKAATLWTSQLFGAACAAITVYAILGEEAKGAVHNFDNHLNWTQAFFMEAALTFVLVWAILERTQRKIEARRAYEEGFITALVLGITVTLLVAMGAWYTGGSMNPVRSMAPALFYSNSGHYVSEQLWVYFTAPFVGGLLANWLHQWLNQSTSKTPIKMTEPHQPAPSPKSLPPFKHSVVFVCVENSNRSQMAQAFARMYASEMGLELLAFSAGSRPSGVVNPKAIAAMAELQYVLQKHQSKGLDALPDIEFDAVVTMGCGDECPFVRGRIREDWPLPDPKHMEPKEFNEVRDEIGRRVKELLVRVVATLP